jgi:hypothetical protein
MDRLPDVVVNALPLLDCGGDRGELSSVTTMSEASFATSVPAIPMATPISAALIAGASLTPSPVIATMAPFRFHA